MGRVRAYLHSFGQSFWESVGLAGLQNTLDDEKKREIFSLITYFCELERLYFSQGNATYTKKTLQEKAGLSQKDLSGDFAFVPSGSFSLKAEMERVGKLIRREAAGLLGTLQMRLVRAERDKNSFQILVSKEKKEGLEGRLKEASAILKAHLQNTKIADNEEARIFYQGLLNFFAVSVNLPSNL